MLLTIATPACVVNASNTRAKNEKIMRRVVRAVLSGTELGDLSSLVNPDAVDELRAVAAAEAPTPP